jgi:hypothetical protein
VSRTNAPEKLTGDSRSGIGCNQSSPSVGTSLQVLSAPPPPRSDRWAWSARAEILGNDGPETRLSNLMKKTRNLSWAAYVEGWVEGDRIAVRLLVDGQG